MSGTQATAFSKPHSLADAGALAVLALLGAVFVLPYRLWLALAPPMVFPAHFEMRMLLWSALIALVLPLLQIVVQIRRFGGTAIRGNRVGFPEDDGPGGRIARAHRNMTESLLPFAAAAVAVDVFGVSSRATAAAAGLYLAARLVHAVTYIAGITVLRSAAFYAGVLATAILVFHALLLGAN